MSYNVHPAPRRSGGRAGCAPDPPAELMDRVAAGDRAAFADLYDALAPRAFGLARRVVRDPGMAEDVTQEAMLELWRCAARYDAANGSVSAWMLTITHRRAIDRVRAETTGRHRERTVTAHSALIAFDHVADTIERNEQAQMVRSCLAWLTDRQREAILLAYYDGYTYPEVAAELGISLPAAKARIRAALQRLRESVPAPSQEN